MLLFFGKRVRKRIYKTRDLTRADVFDYIEVFFTIEQDVTAIWVASVLRRLSAPQFEVRVCLPHRGKSKVICYGL